MNRINKKYRMTDTDKTFLQSVNDREKLDITLKQVLMAASKDELFALLK